MRRASRATCGLAAAALGAAGLVVPAPAEAPPAHYSWAKRVAAAKRFADGRAGRISFAVVDEAGRLHGSHPDRIHNSASVVKVLFMVALLREPGVRHDELNGSEKALLEPMIKRSDNQAATAVFNRVGQQTLVDLAQRIGLRHFTTQPTWGLTTITAGSQARFFSELKFLIPKRHRRYALHLLTKIVPSQRWGIPPVAPRGWTLHFKGGWSGAPSWRVNQVMLLRRAPRRFAIAVSPASSRRWPTASNRSRASPGVCSTITTLSAAEPRSGGINGPWERDPGSPRHDA